jgi:tetratricopeptide (TPR) repeat protein
MMRHKHILPFVVAFIFLAGAAQASARTEPVNTSPRDGTKRVALLVGVNVYDHPNFDDLRYAEKDVTDLAAALGRLGFQTEVLTGSASGERRATKQNIERKLENILKGIRKTDIVLIALSGHGVQMRNNQNKEEPFYCPVDAVKDDRRTLFSLSYLIDNVLANRGGRNLVVIDACRNSTDAATRGAKGIQGQSMTLPGNTGVFFSCKQGQQSFENEKAGHGIFTYCLLDGLTGNAAKDGVLTWSGLVFHVQEKMQSAQVRQWVTRGALQQPIPVDNLDRTVLGTFRTLTANKPVTTNKPSVTNSRGPHVEHPALSAIGHRNLADTLAEKGDLEKAITEYTDAIHVNPKDAISYIRRGNMYHKRNEAAKAMADYNEATHIDPSDPAPYNNRGNIYRERKDYSKALAEYAKALDVHPKYRLAYQNRAKVYDALGDARRASADRAAARALGK